MVVGVLLGLAGPAAAATPSEDPALQAFAAKSFAERYGVSYEAAYRRLETQDRAADLTDKLEARLGDSFAGVWFGPGSRDFINIGVARSESQRTDSDAVNAAEKQAADEGLTADTHVVGVESSSDELASALEAVNSRLGSLFSERKVRTGLNPSTNAITVETASVLTDAEAAQIRSAVSTAPVQVRLSDTGQPTLSGGGDACNYPFCDRPLRGGVRVGIDAVYRCTAGFNAKGRNIGRSYILTAGHCLDDDATDAGTWSTRTEGQTLHAIGSRFNWNFPDKDAGLIRVSDGSFWQGPPAPAPTVFVDSGPNTTVDDNYEINNETSADIGEFVCRTSGVSFTSGEDYTRCGTIQATNVTSELEPGQIAKELVETDMCRLRVSSGGPTYKNHLAYGTHSGGDGPPDCKAWYTPARLAENDMNVDIVHP